MIVLLAILAFIPNAYNTAKEQGLWENSYVVTNYYEYFAVGANIWFGENVAWLRNYVGASRESLRGYDRNLADLLEEVFGDHPWRWTPVRERLHLPHLQGYDAVNTPHMNFNALQPTTSAARNVCMKSKYLL